MDFQHNVTVTEANESIREISADDQNADEGSAASTSASICSAAASIIDDCRKQFENTRINADSGWDKICENSIEFASKHGVNTEFPDKRRQPKTRMTDELTLDECMTGTRKLKLSSKFLMKSIYNFLVDLRNTM